MGKEQTWSQKVLVHRSSIKRSPGRHLSPVIPGALLIPERGVRASPRPLQRTGAFAVLAPLLWEELKSSRPPYYSSYIGAGLGTWRTEGETSRNRLPPRRSEERRVGKECVGKCRSRCSPY